MPTLKLTNTSVRTLRPAAKVYIAYDCALPGFGCRVTPTGAKSWIVEYRLPGGGRRASKRRMTIGSAALISADKARSVAQDILARARLGTDIAQERADLRTAATFRELAVRYLREEVRPTRKPRTSELYEAYLRKHVLPEFASRQARDITKSDIVRLHRALGETKPVTANRVLMLLSGVFSWARSMGELPQDFKPTAGISRFKESNRERYLTEEELSRLGEALLEAETVGLPWPEGKATSKHVPRPENRITSFDPSTIAALRLLLLTGCRLREILHLKWDYVDIERGLLFLPDSKSGAKTVVLPDAAVSILRTLPRVGQFVVTGRSPDQPRHDLQRPWAAVTHRAGLFGIRIHDLRHTYASIGAASGLGLQILGKLLGHRDVQTTSRYAHLAASPLRRASDQIAGQIMSALYGAGRAETFEIGDLEIVRP